MSTLAPEQPLPLQYDPVIEGAIAEIVNLLTDGYPLTPRAIALLLLQGDPEITEMVRAREGDHFPEIARKLETVRKAHGEGMDAAIVLQRHEAARGLINRVITHPFQKRVSFGERLSRLCTSPMTGLPILVLVTWFGLYQFVGIFGGGTLVGLLEENLFGNYINPWVTALVERWIPWSWLSDLFVGEYGIWTLGITYAVALIFPIVGTFFLAFSVLEDSGYLPRMAMLIDRLFKGIGLNGKAVIPIVLGFGCDTMATLVTRVLETPRERIITTFLLSLAIPCSAQLGVMTALLAGHPVAFWLWAGIMAGIFLVIGYLTSKVLPGESAHFTMELPPLRWPSLANIATKTFARMQWYFMEVLPLFILASVFIWVGQLTHLFDLVIRALQPVAHILGLPDAAAEVFLFGFFRRDYGGAGLYKLNETGALSGNQLLVSVVTLTIFLPCVAQFLMMKKERGTKMAVAMAAFIFPFAILVGSILNLVLEALHLSL
ncbi:MAG TPA: ferrous iron transporter B [Chthonomonadales bacterium]|nr:ferrous iron transporter B [Chthonomonadales bacterium]